MSTATENNLTEPSTIPVIKLLPEEVALAAMQPGLFTAALIHEIRNPLSNINLSVEILEQLMTDESQQTYLDIILRASAKINSLISVLIHEHQPEQLPSITYSLHHLLDEVLLLSADRLLLKNIRVIRVYSLREYMTASSRAAMKIAFGNIILNAIDAMTEAGQLQLITDFKEDNFIITITDNGCGIAAEHLDKIFTPYFTNKKDGLGIGLAATRDIFDTHQVQVDVTSTIGSGTSFVLTFEKEKLVPFVLPAIKLVTA